MRASDVFASHTSMVLSQRRVNIISVDTVYKVSRKDARSHARRLPYCHDDATLVMRLSSPAWRRCVDGGVRSGTALCFTIDRLTNAA
jgi:hypothetical protein